MQAHVHLAIDLGSWTPPAVEHLRAPLHRSGYDLCALADAAEAREAIARRLYPLVRTGVLDVPGP